jgi:hypothetical protein
MAGELAFLTVNVPEAGFIVFGASGEPDAGPVAVETDYDVTVTAQDASVAEGVANGEDAHVFGVCGECEE